MAPNTFAINRIISIEKTHYSLHVEGIYVWNALKCSKFIGVPLLRTLPALISRLYTPGRFKQYNLPSPIAVSLFIFTTRQHFSKLSTFTGCTNSCYRGFTVSYFAACTFRVWPSGHNNGSCFSPSQPHQKVINKSQIDLKEAFLSVNWVMGTFKLWHRVPSHLNWICIWNKTINTCTVHHPSSLCIHQLSCRNRNIIHVIQYPLLLQLLLLVTASNNYVTQKTEQTLFFFQIIEPSLNLKHKSSQVFHKFPTNPLSRSGNTGVGAKDQRGSIVPKPRQPPAPYGSLPLRLC